MRNTASKIKNKSSKGLEQDNVTGVNVKSRGKARNDFSFERSTSTYEPYTSSTSESEPERKRNSNRNKVRQLSTKNGKKYRDTNNEVCITVPERGKGNVRIVGNTNPGLSGPPNKQVDFSSFDAVYGTTSEVSSDEEADGIHVNKKGINVYRVEGQANKVFIEEPEGNRDLSGRQHLAPNNNKNLSVPEKDSAKNDLRSRRMQSTETDQLVDKSRAQPTLTLPLFSVSIQTSEEEVSREPLNGKKNMGTEKPSSQLFKLKQHLLGIENDAGEQHKYDAVDRRNRKEVPECDTLETTEQEKELRDADQNGTNKINPKHEIYFVSEKGTDTADLRGALEQLLKASSANTKSRITEGNVESENKYNDNVRFANGGVTAPLIYVATLGNNTLTAFGRGPKDEATGENRENSLRTSSNSIPKSVSLNKSPSKQSSKKKIEVVGSKIGMKKSKRSFLSSYIPKPSSVCSRKRSSIVLSKTNKNVQESLSKTSKKYVVRDIMVIPEEQVGKQFANPAQPHDHDISEELAEREIRLHDLNNDHDYETDQPLTSSPLDKGADSSKLKQKNLDRNSPINLKDHNEGVSIPCLYYCSTSTVDTGGGTKTDHTVNSKGEDRNNQKPVTANPSLITKSNNRQQDSGIVYDKNVTSNYNEKVNTILIEPETHREIMKAINASNGAAGIISIPTKISRKESTGKRLSLGVKRSKVSNPLRRPVSLVETITEEDTQDEIQDNIQNKNVKPVQFMSNDVSDTMGNIETDHSELFEINDYQTTEQPVFDKSHPFTMEHPHKNATNFLAFPARFDNTTPMHYKHDKEFENDQNSNNVKKRTRKRNKTELLRPDRPRESIGTILSFSEPLIQEESQADFKVSKDAPLDPIGKRAVGSKSKRKSQENKFMTNNTPMVYVGRMPDTTYNVFFSPDEQPYPQGDKNDREKNDARNIRSDTKKLSPIKSEKLLAQGPKAILIFVNKKTELNRNPFDGNVVYDDDDAYGKGRKDKGLEKSGKGKGKDHRKHGKHKDKSNDKSGRGTDFDGASSIHHPGSRKSGEDGVIVEKSPSGLKTVVKYPCGCMKITKIDPENGSVSEEITSAFCTLGSKCDISQSQKDKRLIRYTGDSSESRQSPSTSRDLPRCPQLDIVLEGIMSKKPIKPQPPAPKMRGTNLTGTLTIKTNRCNGVFNFYIDPRLKQYLRNNFGCDTNNQNSYSHRSYSS